MECDGADASRMPLGLWRKRLPIPAAPPILGIGRFVHSTSDVEESM